MSVLASVAVAGKAAAAAAGSTASTGASLTAANSVVKATQVEALKKVAEAATSNANALSPELSSAANETAVADLSAQKLDFLTGKISPDQMLSHDNFLELNKNKVGRFDDNGQLIKDEKGNLLPNVEYESNGNHYATNANGHITNWNAELRDTPENVRDECAQREVGGGGEYHGGHLVARMNGGSAGSENLVPMRGTINSGDYLRVERVENQLVKEGHSVHETGRLEWEGDTLSTFDKHVSVDGVERINQKIGNVKGSTELLNDLDGVLSEEQMSQLKEVLSDMKADECEVSITSYTKECDAEGNVTSVRVDYRNESAEPKPTKDHMTFNV